MLSLYVGQQGSSTTLHIEEVAEAGGITTLQASTSLCMVNRCRVLFPPLHTKLGLIKQFAIALDNDGDCFAYMCQVFPGVTVEKLKAGILDGSQIQQLIRDPEFENSMKAVELEAGKAFVRVVETFLGNKRPATMKYLSPIC